MIRVTILGNSGSGKSTLARRLAAQSSVPILDLDTIAWEPGVIAVPRSVDAAHADLAAFCDAHAGWVVEGCYGALVAATFERSPDLLFLDPGADACIANCKARPWEPHKYKSREEQDERLAFLLGWVADYYTRDGDMSYAVHRRVFDAYTGPKQQLTELPGDDFVWPPRSG